MKHSNIATNGINLHVVELGEGQPVLLCHGFPDTWRGWRRQMEALADGGYRAIAVDMRGYGRSSAPTDEGVYTPFHTVGDLVGLLDVLKISTVSIVGHDFGADVAWNATMMRPDRFKAIFAISVPFLPHGETSFLEQLHSAGLDDFYMFQLMRAESDAVWDQARNPISSALYWLSAAPPPEERFDPFDPTRMFDRPAPMDVPPWADKEDVAFTTSEFRRTGFRGGLNYYRSIQPGFDLAAPFKGSLIYQPSFFVMGEADGLKELLSSSPDGLRECLPGLRGQIEIKGAGHWVQQEKPEAVNDALLGFLREIR